MRPLLALIEMLALVLQAPAPARAEQATAAPAVQGLILPNIVSPTAITCHDFRNRLVNIIDVRALGDAGRAEYIPAQGPVIMVDPDLMATLPENLQVFFKLHECGHHALGHLYAPSDRSEKEADCAGASCACTPEAHSNRPIAKHFKRALDSGLFKPLSARRSICDANMRLLWRVMVQR